MLPSIAPTHGAHVGHKPKQLSPTLPGRGISGGTHASLGSQSPRYGHNLVPLPASWPLHPLHRSFTCWLVQLDAPNTSTHTFFLWALCSVSFQCTLARCLPFGQKLKFSLVPGDKGKAEGGLCFLEVSLQLLLPH